MNLLSFFFLKFIVYFINQIWLVIISLCNELNYLLFLHAVFIFHWYVDQSVYRGVERCSLMLYWMFGICRNDIVCVSLCSIKAELFLKSVYLNWDQSNLWLNFFSKSCDVHEIYSSYANLMSAKKSRERREPGQQLRTRFDLLVSKHLRFKLQLSHSKDGFNQVPVIKQSKAWRRCRI